jgi:hypothetical protein
MVVIGPGGWLGVGVLETEQGCAENGKDGFFHFLPTQSIPPTPSAWQARDELTPFSPARFDFSGTSQPAGTAAQGLMSLKACHAGFFL